jgi:hypothetical protein
MESSMRDLRATSFVLCFLSTMSGCSSSSGSGDETAGGGEGGSAGTAEAQGGSSGSSSVGSGGAMSMVGQGGAGGMTSGSGGTMSMVGQGGAGGSSGSGGTMGAGGAPKNSPCPDLPAAGTWKNISPPNTDYMNTTTGLNAPAFRPDDPATIYIGADSHGMFRSTNCGSTWTKVNTGRHATEMSSGRPWSLAIDPVTPDVMYSVQGYGANGLWKTTNAGVDWDQIETANVTSAFPFGGFTEAITIDPTNHEHLIVEPHGTGTGQCASGCLAESNDEGKTWSLLAAPGWGENSGVAVVDAKNWFFCDFFNGFYHTTDGGASWHDATITGGGGIVSCNYYTPFIYRRKDGTFFAPTQNGVIQSVDGASWTTTAKGKFTTLVGTGTHLIAGNQWSPGMFTATEANPATWTSFPSAPGLSNSVGSVYLTYDATHKVLYSSSFTGGLWETVTE